VTFVASTGDYGASDPEYPAFSPNVLAVGGTSLMLNADSSYNSETGWGYYSSCVGASIGSGGGISLYEPEPGYQEGVQSLGMRTTPDVSLFADPATGAWIADSYNLDPGNPFEVVGGTSLSAPAWAGLLAIVNQGRAASGAAALNSTGPTEAQQALYNLPQSDYNTVTSGSNGYSAGAGYNLVTGLGTPVANLLVSDLVAYQGPGTSYSGPTVGSLQCKSLDGNWTGSGGPINVFSVFDSLMVTSVGLKPMRGNAEGRAKAASRDGTNAVRFAEQPLSNVLGGVSTVNGSAPRDRLPQALASPTSTNGSAVDQVLGVVLDADSHETLIEDLAFGRILSGTHKVKRIAAPGTLR
jgi:subtilase family serine protease